MWVYRQTEEELWTVGFYAPDGTWHTDSDHGTKGEAATRVHYLNGKDQAARPPDDYMQQLQRRLNADVMGQIECAYLRTVESEI